MTNNVLHIITQKKPKIEQQESHYITGEKADSPEWYAVPSPQVASVNSGKIR